jgi:hypothetical protein
MRRWLGVAAALALLLPACARDDPVLTPPVDVGPTPSPTAQPTPSPTPSPTPTGDDLAGASCEDREGGNDYNFPDFVRVKVEREDGVEKVEFRFEPEDGVTDPPVHFISFADQLTTEGEGAPVDLEGNAYLSVSFMARGVDLSGEDFEEIYTGPKRLTPGFPTVKELQHLGDFEGLISWGIGLESRACYVLRARADRLILRFPSG